MSDLIIKPSGTSANFKVQNPSGTDKIVMNSSGTITTATLGSAVDLGLTANHSGVKTAINASGAAPIYACRAWAQINGTNNNLNADGNISSVTESSDLYTVNLETALEDANYSVNVSFKRQSGDGSSAGYVNIEKSQTLSNSSFKIYFFNTAGDTINPGLIFVSVFR